MSQIEGNLIGLGVELWAEKEELRIVEVFQGSPADFAGLTTGDRILQVGSAVTAEISAKKAADLLRGPEHSQVRLVIARKDLQPQEVVVTRRRVEVPSVASADMSIPMKGSATFGLRISKKQPLKKSTMHCYP